MAYIGREPQIGNFQVCDAISVVNGQAAYTMQVSSVNVSPETANHMIVSLNGIIQAPGSSYTVSGSTITFASNLVTGDVIDFIHILGSVLDLGVPSDSTVSLAKLTATGTKNSTTFLRGDNTFAEAGGGKLLQVIQATDSTTRSTTSTSYVHASSTLSVDITPATTSSKIFISASFSARKDSGMTAFTVFRDGSAITGAGNLAEPRFNSGDWQSMNGFNWLDSPSTTSSVNYRLYMKSSEGSNTSYLNYNSVTGTITVMEIGA